MSPHFRFSSFFLSYVCPPFLVVLHTSIFVDVRFFGAFRSNDPTFHHEKVLSPIPDERKNIPPPPAWRCGTGSCSILRSFLFCRSLRKRLCSITTGPACRIVQKKEQNDSCVESVAHRLLSRPRARCRSTPSTSRTRRVVANFWQNLGKISFVFGCISADLCKKIRD